MRVTNLSRRDRLWRNESCNTIGRSRCLASLLRPSSRRRSRRSRTRGCVRRSRWRAGRLRRHARPQGRASAFMALADDLWRCANLQSALSDAGLDVVDSYVSLTELSEYAQGVPEAMRQARLHPQLPPEGKPAWCFYPMSKRRGSARQLVHAALRRAQRAHARARRVGPQVRRAGAAGHHRLDGARRLRVGRDAVRGASRRPQRGRLHDALRRGVGASTPSSGPFYTGMVAHGRRAHGRA